MSSNDINTDLRIEIADWQEHQAELREIRKKVFIDEQNVPEELEWDGEDESSTHFIVTLQDKPVATARLKPDGQLGRMAVLSEYRNRSIGSQLLQFILKFATEQKFKSLYLHAQTKAIPFYERQGYNVHGKIFYEADIPHIKMLYHGNHNRYILGEDGFEIQIDKIDDYRDIVTGMIQQARHSINIFTQDLEADIYSNNLIEQAMLKLAKRHPDTRVRILVQDSGNAVRNGHCLIRLAQQLSSSIFIHQLPERLKSEKCAFLLADRTGIIFRPNGTGRNYQASASFKDPGQVAMRQELFDDAWEHSSPDIQVRRIYL